MPTDVNDGASLSDETKANGEKLDRIIELLERFEAAGDRFVSVVEQIRLNTAKPRQSA